MPDKLIGDQRDFQDRSGESSELPAPSSVKRLFILRPDNLGDLILFSGALKHIRRHWPKAKITLCVRPFGLELFRHCPDVDELVSYDEVKNELLTEGRLRWTPLRGGDRLGGWLRRHAPRLAFWPYRCDLALLPVVTPMPEHHLVMRKIPSRTKIGVFGHTAIQAPEWNETSRPWYTAQMDASALPWNLPELSANRKFLEFLGIRVTGEELWPEFWTTPEDVKWAEKHIPDKKEGIILGVAPGKSSNPRRTLPSAWFSGALTGLSAKDMTVVLLGSKPDQTLCGQIKEGLDSAGVVRRVIDLCGQTSVGQSVECIRRCTLLLSQDTAAVHIATALHKPVACILGGGHFGRFFPWGDAKTTRVISKPMDCYGCNWVCKYETMRCIQEILPEEATAILNELILLP